LTGFDDNGPKSEADGDGEDDGEQRHPHSLASFAGPNSRVGSLKKATRRIFCRLGETFSDKFKG
jgi:hypothetical protein